MLRSLLALRDVDAGFDPRQRADDGRGAAADALRHAGAAAARSSTRAAADARAAGRRGRRRRSTTCRSPGGSVQPIVLEGRPELLPRDQPTVQVRKVTPGYLRDDAHPDPARPRRRRQRRRGAAGQPQRREAAVGRRRSDRRSASRCRCSRGPCCRTVVGIVGDVKQGDLAEPPPPTVYEYTRERDWRGLTLVAADVGAAGVAGAAGAGVVRALDPEQPVEDVRTMDDVLRRDADVAALQRAAARARSRRWRWCSPRSASTACCRTSCAAAAARSASATALGAQAGDVLRLVVLEGHDAGADRHRRRRRRRRSAAATVLETLVFGVSASDPLTLAAVAATLALVALARQPGARLSRVAAGSAESAAHGVSAGVSAFRA